MLLYHFFGRMATATDEHSKKLYNCIFRSMKRTHDMFAMNMEKFVEGPDSA